MTQAKDQDMTVQSPAHIDQLLTVLANSIVDVMVASYGPEEGCKAALAAVDRMIANPSAGCCDLDRVRRQCAEIGISADSPADLGPEGEQLAALERADYDGGDAA
jgi:hypothetical protein